MYSIDSVYRKENGRILIELTLSSVDQLFHSFDPSPFHKKELDPEAERYIVDIVDDFSRETEFHIIIYLPEDIRNSAQAQKIPEAIRNHFQYRALMQNQLYKERSRYGKFTIIVGLVFLAIATLASHAVADHFPDSLPALLVAKALEVAGWVAMWEPVTVHLYQLWPIIKQRRIYEKIAGMEIDVLPQACSESQDSVNACLLKR
ncbi:MAG: hypothetical protein GYA23_03815 [Methanomicrobiales archaeon]|nr:hypothetical protein [Methanomicrobiales archaeon]